MEHVAGGEDGLSLFVEIHIRSEFVAIAADNLLCLWVPDDELFVAVFHRVELVEVEFLARSSSGSPESLFALASYLAYHVRCVVIIDDIDFVCALVGDAELAFCCEFTLEDLLVDGRNNRLHLLIFFIRSYYFSLPS